MEDTQLKKTARCIQRWAAMLSQLAQSLDADRVAYWLGPVAAKGWSSASAYRRLRVIRAWSGWSGVPLSALDPPASQLVVLSPALLAKVLVSRALFSRAVAVRRCIERERLNWIEQCVGPRVLEQMRQHAGPQHAGTRLALPLLPRDADQAAWIGDGWRRLEADGMWPHPVVAKLLSLSLPLGATQVAPVRADGASDAFLSALPTFIPEASCVFG